MKHYHFKTIDSTSTYLKNNYNKLENLTFVSADYQTNGHGRYNRKWYGEHKKDLLFSILIKDKELISKYGYLSLASAVVIYKILKEISLKNISIKWPNDVLIGERKISGILLEGISISNSIEALIVGVGLNVNSSTLKKDIINSTTSIYLETNREFSLDEIKKTVFSKFCEMLNKIKNNDYSYLQIVKENNYLKGKMVYATINNEKKLVKIIDINNDNSLKIELEGKCIDLHSGEISFHK